MQEDTQPLFKARRLLHQRGSMSMMTSSLEEGWAYNGGWQCHSNRRITSAGIPQRSQSTSDRRLRVSCVAPRLLAEHCSHFTSGVWATYLKTMTCDLDLKQWHVGKQQLQQFGAVQQQCACTYLVRVARIILSNTKLRVVQKKRSCTSLALHCFTFSC